VDKAWVHQQDYRKVNGWYVYGGRRTWDTETFPLEYKKIRNMVAVRDHEIWAIAQGKKSNAEPDDSQTGELHVPPSRFGNPSQKYSEAEELQILSPEEFIAKTEVPPGFKIELFADETMFPELANPVQATFDNRGRYWVSCMPTYPQWKPGEPKPNDKLLIFEDSNGDGKADLCKTFYDKLHCPTGFEFWNDGVLVVDQPRLLFLKDTDGDDVADVVVHLLDGWATDDTHHSCSSFQWNNAGYVHMLEGIATSTTLETPWGPHLSHGNGGAYVLDPKTLKIKQFSLPGQYNMWSYSFDQWGQGFPGDGTTCNQAWDSPLSGAPFAGRKGIRFVVDNEGMRPGMGNEFLVTRHFPDEVQGQFTYSCVINMNGLPRFSFGDDGGGFGGKRLKKPDGSPDDLIRSDDKHFRPGNPQVGPDGALWFLDWSNALIGHMQYSQRDPNRDRSHGRIYRLVYPSRPLLEPITQFGKSVAELLEQLRTHEWRTRYRVRRELAARQWRDIEPQLQRWLEALDPQDSEYDRLRCETLWIQEWHHRLDLQLLAEVASNAKRFEARAAAVHLIADARERVADSETLLIAASQDAHPRVRVEAARGLSFFPTVASMQAVFAMFNLPADYWADYTIYHTLGANQNVWKPELLAGRITLNQRANEMLAELFASSELDRQAYSLISDAHRVGDTLEQRNKAMATLTEIKGGSVSEGHDIFKRNCANCHLVGDEGRNFGPNLSDVGKRLSRFQIVESIVIPNANVEEKYRTTMVLTFDGNVISGLLVGENDTEVEIYDGKESKKIPIDEIEERKVQAQSSMPDELAIAMSPAEFIHLIEFLSSLRETPKE
jgi:putative heme-binding domain-containing protein